MYIIRIKRSIIILCKGGVHMFDVKKPEMANKTFRLPVELIRRLETVAQQKGVSVNNLVLQCCQYALDNLKEENSDK